MLLLLFLFFIVTQSRRTDYPPQILKSQITHLPGLDNATFQKYTMFSGYIDVYPAHNRSLFYWFVESLNNPITDPVAIWTNGGPACSGIGGMFTEQGPFLVDEELKLYVNNYSWVNVANMIFFEIPAGVGFSFSDDLEDYYTDDNKTAIDNYHFIQEWLTEFPNYQNNSFYLTAESYGGGHYVPTLAQQIILGNNDGGKPQINLRGFYVGNPCVDLVEWRKGVYNTYYGHQLTSEPTYLEWYNVCDNGKKINEECRKVESKMEEEVGDLIDPYALDYPSCINNEKIWFMKKVIKDSYGYSVPGLYNKYVKYLEKNMEEKKNNIFDFDFPSDNYDPCLLKYLIEWINKPEVQNAIHAKPTIWMDCTWKVEYSYKSIQNPMEPTYKWIIQNDPSLHITIVSGDDDSVCPTLGTQSWIWDMGYSVDPQNNWIQWIDSTGQLGGYITKFQNAFNFITVHSAGHMIPETSPRRSLETFMMYLNGTV